MTLHARYTIDADDDTLSERPLDDKAPPPDGDVFDSIYRPGSGLYLRAWPDIPAAQAGIAGAAGHHRLVQVIRDYGKFARIEAPQYFPPA